MRMPRGPVGVWAAGCLLVASLLVDSLWGSSTPALVLAVISLVVHVGAFLTSGGASITPLGIYMLANGVFVGIGGILMVVVGVESEATPWLIALLTALNLIVFAAGRRLGTIPVLPDRIPTRIPVVAFVVGVAGATVAPGELAYPMVLIGVTVMALWGTSSDKRPGRVLGYLGAAALVLGYLSEAWTGWGRLLLATMGFAALLVVNWKHPRWLHKFGLVVVIGAGLVVAGLVRAPEASSTQVFSEGAGLYSVYSPLDIFEQVVHLERRADPMAFERQYGQSVWSALVSWVPRQLWAEKPVGLGYQLALHLTPDLALRSGHSLAALHAGDWFIGFGWFGMVLYVLFPLLVLTAIKGVSQYGSPWAVTGLVIASVGFWDYTWVGLHAPAVREGFALLIVLGLAGTMVVLVRARGMPARLLARQP